MKGKKIIKITGAALVGAALLTGVPVMAMAQEDVEKAPVTIQEEDSKAERPKESEMQPSLSKVEDLRKAVREQVLDIQNPPEKIQGFEQYEKAGIPGGFVAYYDPKIYGCEKLAPEEETEEGLYLALKTNPDVNLRIRFFPDMDKEEVIRLYNSKLNPRNSRFFSYTLTDAQQDQENQEGQGIAKEKEDTDLQENKGETAESGLTVYWDDEQKAYFTVELNVPDIGTATLGADSVPSFAVLTNTPGYFIEYYIAANKNGSVAVEVEAPETAYEEFEDLRNIIDTLVMDETLWDQEEVMRYAGKSSDELEEQLSSMDEQDSQVVLDQKGKVVYAKSSPDETQAREE